MSEIGDRLKGEAFGVFYVKLQKKFKFEWFLAESRRISGIVRAVETREKENIHDNIVIGRYYESEQLTDAGFKLKVVEDFAAFIPYEAIDSYKRLGDLSF